MWRWDETYGERGPNSAIGTLSIEGIEGLLLKHGSVSDFLFLIVLLTIIGNATVHDAGFVRSGV